MKVDIKQQHHFFVSCAFCWTVANTREEAIKLMVKEVGKSAIKRITLNSHKAGRRGFYFSCCRVNEPIEGDYDISGFMPEGVDVQDIYSNYVTYVSPDSFKYVSERIKQS